MKAVTPQSQEAHYGLGLQRNLTACGETWGHAGGVPGYDTFMYGDSDNRRQFVASVNSYDMSDIDATNAAFGHLIDTAACGGPPPAPVSAESPVLTPAESPVAGPLD